MGSTSETYENGTNVVVYVANEHARIQSSPQQQPSPQLQLQPSSTQLQLQPQHQFQFQPQQHQQQQQQHHHRYLNSQQIVTTSAPSSDDSEPPSPSVYKVCPPYGPPPPPSPVSVSATVANYELSTASGGGRFFESCHEDHENSIHQHQHSSCSINGGVADIGANVMCDHRSNGNSSFAFHTTAPTRLNGLPASSATAPATPTTLYLNEKLVESNTNPSNFVSSAGASPVPTPATGIVAAQSPEVVTPFAPRSESARSVDSVNSVSSSLSSSSSNVPTPSASVSAVAGKHLSVENFVAPANNPSSCAGEGAVTTVAAAATFGNATKQCGVTFTSSPPAPYRIVPIPFSIANKEIGGSNAAAAAAAATAAAFQKPAVSVPFGWKRIVNNGSVIYISPDNTFLHSLEQVNSYLLTDGNCFCGLDCPLYSHTVFNFDPEVVTSPVPASSGELSKLCNHKRKRSASSIGPSTVLQNQSYENIAPQNTIASRHLVDNNYNPAVVKKYGFDISDRKKKREIMSGQMYMNDDTTVPSNNVMVQNDCDISAKETNTSIINPMSQVENNAYSHQKIGMTVSMTEQPLPAPGVPTMRLKTPAINQGFQNQSAFFNARSQNDGFSSQEDCYSVYPHQNRPVYDQNNVYLSQEVFPGGQNNGGYVCNQAKNNGSHQQPCRVAAQPQHQRQQQQQQPQQQFISQTYSPAFQQMRIIPNHHGSNAMQPTIPLDGQMNMQMVNDDKFTGQVSPHQVEKNNMYHVMPETDNSCTMAINSYHVAKNDAPFCNCYHNDNSGHVHHPPSPCLKDCNGANCSSVLVQNAPGQLIHHDANGIMQSSQSSLHQPANAAAAGQHHSMYPNQMQSQQLYPHHLHHHHHHQQQRPEQSPKIQQQQQQQKQQQQIQPVPQTQQLFIIDPHQSHPSAQSAQHQQQIHSHQVHVMQPTNIEIKKSSGNRCISQSMHPQIGIENETVNQNMHFIHQNQIAQQRTNWNQKSVSPATTLGHGVPALVPGPPPSNPYERVPPLHHHMPPVAPNSWSEELSRKKFIKGTTKSPTNVGARKQKTMFAGQNNNASNHAVKGRHEVDTNAPVPSFMDDPSGYLAQQTALLNSTISKQTGESPHSNNNNCFSQSSRLISSCVTNHNMPKSVNRTVCDESKGSIPEVKTPDSSVQSDTTTQTTSFNRKNSMTGNPSMLCRTQVKFLEESPVSSSTYTDKEHNSSASPSGSKSPIQAGTVSTSNQSPLQPGTRSPSVCGTPNTSSDALPQSPSTHSGRSTQENDYLFTEPMATAVASACSYSSNTITSVLAGKTNTAVVSTSGGVNHTNVNSVNVNSGNSSCRNNGSNSTNDGHNSVTMSHVSGIDYQQTSNSSAILASSPVSQFEPLTKSPLEMVQNVVSSIQIPSQTVCGSGAGAESKPSPMPQNNGLHASHFLLSNNGQLLMATSSNPSQSQHAAAGVSQQQNHHHQHHLATSSTKMNSPLTMINNSSVVTNASGTVTQMIPTVGVTQQMISQPTVLVNTLPSGQLVFQPSMMALDSAGNAVQIPQLTVATNNMLTSPTLAEAGTISVAGNGSFSPRGGNHANLLSPESAKRKFNAKKRKLSPQHMLISPGSQNGAGTSSVVVQQSQPQQNFAQSAPMLQTLILPNKGGQFASAQPLIATANVLQPVNLVHNIPTIQQFIVPAGLGGMVMNSDGTATILPETVQLNVLTPMHNAANAMFGHAGSQGILTASPATGMVIRTQPGASQTGQLRSQTISTPNGTQFITTQSPNQFIVNGSPAFGGQLSPIVANVSPTQQIQAYNTSPTTTNLASRTATPQEYLQCMNAGGVNGQTLMVPCSVAQQSANPQNTTVVQQNTTIVQQQMTMVSNNQQLPENSTSSSSSASHGSTGANTGSTINLGQHNIILNDGKQSQNFIITTDKTTAQQQSGYILSPNKNDKHQPSNTQSQQQHFILNNLNSEKQSQSFIISSPSDKPICGNFILANASEKTNGRSSNFIITSASGQTAATMNSCSQATASVAAALPVTTSTSAYASMNSNRFARHSVSTQTANAAAAAAAAAAANTVASTGQQVLQISSTPTLIVATNNTFSQTSNSSYSSSPPDTTTHSPVGTSGQSPDTPSSSSIVVGSTDDMAASPTSSTTPVGGQPMVHCISSSNVVDWSESTFEEKKLNIIVDHSSSSELIAGGIDMFQSIGSMQPHFRRRHSGDAKESMSYIESSTFDESSIRK